MLLLRSLPRAQLLTLSVNLSILYSNELESGRAITTLWDGHPQWPGLMVWDQPKQLKQRKYLCDLSPDGTLYWVEEVGQPRRHFTGDSLADHIITYFMDEVQKRSVTTR